MSRLKTGQIDHNGSNLKEVVALKSEVQQELQEAAYTHPATHDISMITGGASVTYVDQKVADLVASSPATLDTLNELASALGNDPNFATTVATNIGQKASMKIITSTFAAGTTSLVVNDAFIVEATCKVDVQPQGTKLGTWDATFVNGTITITSDKTETTAVPVRIYVTKTSLI